MSFPRLSKIVVCSLLAFCLLSLQSGLVSGETPAFKHSTRHFSIAQSDLSLSSESQDYLLANNSRPYIDFYFDFMIIDTAMSISAQNIASAEFITYSLLLIFDSNASHSFGYVLFSTTIYSDSEAFFSQKSMDTELYNSSRSVNGTVPNVDYNNKDIVLSLTAQGDLSTTFYTSTTITYYQIDFEVSQDFLDSISDGNEPTDFILYGLLLPLILLSTGVFFIQLFGLAFLISYIALFYWLARTALEEIF